jgi:hypothetical protein
VFFHSEIAGSSLWLSDCVCVCVGGGGANAGGNMEVCCNTLNVLKLKCRILETVSLSHYYSGVYKQIKLGAYISSTVYKIVSVEKLSVETAARGDNYFESSSLLWHLKSLRICMTV